jgi:hypothetical protein
LHFPTIPQINENEKQFFSHCLSAVAERETTASLFLSPCLSAVAEGEIERGDQQNCQKNNTLSPNLTAVEVGEKQRVNIFSL